MTQIISPIKTISDEVMECPIPHNPYIFLNRSQMIDISRDHDIRISNNYDSMVQELYTYDMINPSFIQNIINTDINYLHTLPRTHLFLYAGINKINIKECPQSQVVPYILLSIYCPTLSNTILQTRIPHDNNIPDKRHRCLQEAFELSKNGYLINNISQGNVSSYLQILNDITRFPINPWISWNIFSDITKMHIHDLRYFFNKKTNSDDGKFLNRNQLIFMILRGHIIDLSFLQPIKDRYLFIYKYVKHNRIIKRLLLSLYSKTPIESQKDFYDPLVKIASSPINKLESYILNIGHINISILAQSIGMIIPPKTHSINEYYYDNIIQYQSVINRSDNFINSLGSSCEEIRNNLSNQSFEQSKQYLCHLSDKEIFSIIQCYVPYNSRSQLINYITSLLYTPDFFYPLVRNCTNSQTYLFTPTSDESVLMVSFGTITKYICYECDELINSFTFYGIDNCEEKAFIFKNPNLRDVFSSIQITRLLNTIILFTGFEKLIDKINIGLIYCLQRSAYDETIIHRYHSFDKKYHPIIKKCLLSMFHCGMYMRKWLGPTHPYPLTTAMTKININTDEQIHNEMISLYQMLNQLPMDISTFILDLSIVEFYGKGYGQHNNPIRNYLESVSAGVFCIRISSSLFIGTGFYYLRLFGDIIDNFNPYNVERLTQ